MPGHGTPLSLDQLISLTAAVMKGLPREMDSETAQHWINNTGALAKIWRKEMLPPVERPFVLSKSYRVTLPERRHPFVAAAFFLPRPLIQYPESSKNFIKDVVELAQIIEVMPAKALVYHDVESQVKMVDVVSGKIPGYPQNPTSFCSNLALMIEEQDKGLPGHLSTEHTNVFMVFSKGDFSIVVEVAWKDNAWHISARVPDSETTYPKGTRIFTV